jgi:hypothetical protein
MGISLPTILQGLTLVATLAASGASAAGQALDRYGGRSHAAPDAGPGPSATAPPSAPVDPAAGVRFYALHRDYGLTPDLKPARAPLASGAPATELTGPVLADPAAPPATSPARPATSPSDF